MEDMNHKVDVVEQHPSAFALALSPVRLARVCVHESALDLVRDGPHLTIGVAAADHEVVGDDQLLRNVEDDDALGLLR